jgi:S-DNA-T family DNA segregation ATPase FtsK/SpoIIIE
LPFLVYNDEISMNKEPQTPQPVKGAPGNRYSPDQKSQISPGVNFLLAFERFGYDILGIALLTLAVLSLTGLIWPNLSGGILSAWAGFIGRLFGWGSFWLVLSFLFAGTWLLIFKRRGGKVAWGRVFALEAAAFSSMALLAVFGGKSLERAEAGLDGGIVGWGLAVLVGRILEPLSLLGTIILVLILAAIFTWGILAGSGLWRVVVTRARQSIAPEAVIPLPKLDIQQTERSTPGTPPALSRQPKKQTIPPEYRKNFKVEEREDEKPQVPRVRDEKLPGFDILTFEGNNKPDEKSINQTAGMIEKTLAEFGIPANVVGFKVGPTVTQFAVEPGFLEKEKNNSEGELARQKVRVAQIASLQKDLALALAAERLRIVAPVPGRPYVGIEVPNSRTMAVRLRAILESEQFAKVPSPLAIALGRDVSGNPVVADLIKMPHLLIAGTTGSGKSVCIAAIAVCLAMNNLPKDLRMVMVDPKMVELQRFKGLPHLMGNVETDVERILGVLRWVVAEMDRRYKLLEAAHARNLETFNRRLQRKKDGDTLPYIVVLIDELADLMMSAPDQTEHNLVRLAQMARAVGIHLVVATQRPSTDVVTGLIKANFPARIAFNVASSIDSRVILDTVGAESLLGRGDMLFLPPDVSAPIRSQGVIITDQEVEKFLGYWQGVDTGIQPAELNPWERMMEEEEVVADRDELVERAIEILRGSSRASTSLLQRRLRIGFPRAARLMEELEALGVVGPAQSAGRDREVLIDREP